MRFPMSLDDFLCLPRHPDWRYELIEGRPCCPRDHGLCHASAANVPSVRWHLACGFALAPDPLREALRCDGGREPYAGPSAGS